MALWRRTNVSFVCHFDSFEHLVAHATWSSWPGGAQTRISCVGIPRASISHMHILSPSLPQKRTAALLCPQRVRLRFERTPLCSEIKAGGFARRSSKLKACACCCCRHGVARPIFQPLVMPFVLGPALLNALRVLAPWRLEREPSKLNRPSEGRHQSMGRASLLRSELKDGLLAESCNAPGSSPMESRR